MTTNTLVPSAPTLATDILEAFRERAARHDRDGRYPHDDLDDLRAAEWLRAAVPRDLGGRGLSLVELAREQRRMARYAPSTALSTCMHHYWVGAAADLRAAGVPIADRILRWVNDGDVLASGHGEAGNDVPIALSTTRAERVPGGWRLHGRKLFGSLGPVWDRIGLHAMAAEGPDAPVTIHGFVHRDAPGVTVVDTWDAQGMRATESHDTVLDGVFLADDDVVCTTPAGTLDHPAVGVMFAWAATLIANVYIGVAERALEIAIADAGSRRSIGIQRGTFAHHPLVQQQVATMFLELDAARATVERVAQDWIDGVDHGAAWGAQIMSAKWRAAVASMRIVDLVCEVCGGGSYRHGSELKRLSRDVRASRFHPPTDAFAHEAIGKGLLGVDPSGPRW